MLKASIRDLSTSRKVPKYRVISGPNFPVLGLNTEWVIRIEAKYRKYGPEITPYLNTFHTVIFTLENNLNKLFEWNVKVNPTPEPNAEIIFNRMHYITFQQIKLDENFEVYLNSSLRSKNYLRTRILPGFFLQNKVSYKLSKKFFFDILGFFDEIY